MRVSWGVSQGEGQLGVLQVEGQLGGNYIYKYIYNHSDNNKNDIP